MKTPPVLDSIASFQPTLQWHLDNLREEHVGPQHVFTTINATSTEPPPESALRCLLHCSRPFLNHFSKQFQSFLRNKLWRIFVYLLCFFFISMIVILTTWTPAPRRKIIAKYEHCKFQCLRKLSVYQCEGYRLGEYVHKTCFLLILFCFAIKKENGIQDNE